MWKIRRDRSEQDPDRLHDLANRVIELESEMRLMRVEWEDIVSRVVRSYGRLEQAERRAKQREGPDPSGETVRPAESNLDALTSDDPFTRKLRQVREQQAGGGDAVPQRTDESTG